MALDLLITAFALLSSTPLKAQTEAYAGAFPHVQDFEAGSLEGLGAEWAFGATKGGVVSVEAVTEEEGWGAWRLALQGDQSWQSTEEVVLHLDLAGRIGVTVEFDLQNAVGSGGGGLYVRPSEALSWRLVERFYDYRTGTDGVLHLGVNLDEVVESAGWDGYTEDFQLRWYHYNHHANEIWRLDNLRVQVNADAVGPQVVEVSPDRVGADNPGFDEVTIRFNEAMDPATVDLGDIELWRPDGELAVIVGIEPIPDTEATMFLLTLSEAQSIRGTYSIELGPDLRDQWGNPMNQDGDAVNGEVADGFATSISFAPALLPLLGEGPLLYHQGFEDWPEPPPHWAFHTPPLARLQAADAPDALAGWKHLAFRAGNTNPQFAEVALDTSQLSGRTDVFLDFWAKGKSSWGNTRLAVYFSPDGLAWSAATALSPWPASSYRGYRLDLDAVAAANQIDFAQGLFIRFRHDPYGGGATLFLDEVRITVGGPALWVELEPLTIPEKAGAGAAVGRVYRLNTEDLSAELEVALTSSAPEVASAPAGVTIPAGEISTSFFIGADDNGLETGPLDVVLTASAEGFESGSRTIRVGESAAPRLTLELSRTSDSEAEGGKPIPARLTRDRGFDTEVAVELQSSSIRDLRVPLSVTIPVGSHAVEFTFQVVNDGELDGDQVAEITATAPEFPVAVATFNVLDDDTALRRTLGGQLSGTLPPDEYIVTGDLRVLEGETLTVEPGARLLFEAGRKLEVYGSLLADVTNGGPILISSAAPTPAPGDWEGIQIFLRSGSSSFLRGVELTHATIGLEVSGEGGRASVVEANVHHHAEAGIRVGAYGDFISASQVQIVGNRVHDSQTGIELIASTSGCDSASNAALVAGNEIYRNAGSGLRASAYGSGISGCTIPKHGYVRSEISRNFIHDNGDAGISATGNPKTWTSGGTGHIETPIHNNLLVGNQTGVSLTKKFDGVIANNTLWANVDTGVKTDLTDTQVPVLCNNLIVGSNAGILAHATPTNEVTRVTHNDLFDNTTNWVNYPPAYGDIVTINRNGTPADMYMNLSVDPMFLSEDDSHLDLGSPLVDAGTPEEAPKVDYDGDLRLNLPDIGHDETPYEFTGLVTTLEDEDDGALGAGTGDSLREVMLAAELLPGPQLLTFSEALRGGTITLNGTPLPKVTQDLSVTVLGAGALVVDAAGKSRIFEIGTNTSVTLADLALRRGYDGRFSGAAGINNFGDLTLSGCLIEACTNETSGGALVNHIEATLLIDHSTLRENAYIGTSTSAGGGGLFNWSIATIRDSAIEQNASATGQGGGIYNRGTLSLERCRLTGNTARYFGGAIYSAHESDDLFLITTSTLSGNSAGKGGAVYNAGGDADSILLHCTLSGNRAYEQGGAIYAYSGRAKLVHCTVTANQAVTLSDTGGAGGGLGISQFSATPTTVILHNTILAGNGVGPGGGSPDFVIIRSGTLEREGLFNWVGGDPLLGPLQDNGGLTLTHLPLAGSPVIDAGSTELALDLEGMPLTVDQRGFPRIQDRGVDIGAVEADQDLDDDGMPNEWETAHGLDPLVANPDSDHDQDGVRDLDEYFADTDPVDAISYLRIESIESTEGDVTLTVRPASVNRRYTLEFSDELGTGEWQEAPTWADLPGTGNSLVMSYEASGPSRYYRVRVRVP
ncbi:MAG: right-handed parallel beta-helix repeat-containing protein [Planctomycetes bacterium]|nr:right-handed parallel beta-helix repeat-containing protein [Planctomycetota bacterium]